jgi:hypothetical protein
MEQLAQFVTVLFLVTVSELRGDLLLAATVCLYA